MKPNLTLLFKLTCIVLLATTLQSCSNEIGVWKNDQIKGSIKDDLHKLNTQTFNYIKANDQKNLESVLSKEMIENNTTTTIAGRVSHEMGMDSFKVVNEYFVVNKYMGKDTIDIDNEGINNHKLVYPSAAQEMYIIMYLPVNKNVPNKFLVTAYYTHYNYGWKLSGLDLDAYTVNGKTAPELLALAQQHYEKGYLVSASNLMTQAVTCERPAKTWLYDDEYELENFATKVGNEVNDKYLLPISLRKVSTQPLLLGIYNTVTDDGTLPMVSYQTKIDLKNTEALKKEKEEVKKAVYELMPGINKDRKFLVFAAYHELPSATKNVYHYDMREKL
ncbi:hypothetical protein FFF34_016965 [Inquilinus sp. KBS0705]|nr:hypothetical protein FFF34_016965 [Inquilinus sp. KBS0705]